MVFLWEHGDGDGDCDGDDCYSDDENCDGDGLQRSAAGLKRRLSVRSCELISIFSL